MTLYYIHGNENLYEYICVCVFTRRQIILSAYYVAQTMLNALFVSAPLDTVPERADIIIIIPVYK